jgi:hypothetical protein
MCDLMGDKGKNSAKLSQIKYLIRIFMTLKLHILTLTIKGFKSEYIPNYTIKNV